MKWKYLLFDVKSIFSLYFFSASYKSTFHRKTSLMSISSTIVRYIDFAWNSRTLYILGLISKSSHVLLPDFLPIFFAYVQRANASLLIPSPPSIRESPPRESNKFELISYIFECARKGLEYRKRTSYISPSLRARLAQIECKWIPGAVGRGGARARGLYSKPAVHHGSVSSYSWKNGGSREEALVESRSPTTNCQTNERLWWD